MNRSERRGRKTESRMLNDESGMWSDEKSQLRTPNSELRTLDPGLRFQSLEVHIEELVLHGFAPGDRRGIGDAVERELMRLLVEQGVPLLFAQDSEVRSLDAGRFAVAAEARGGTIGAQIAQAVYGGIRE